MEYAVCEANSAADLAKTVSARLSEGWRLYGNLAVSNAGPGNWWYYQAVVRGECSDADPGDTPDHQGKTPFPEL